MRKKYSEASIMYVNPKILDINSLDPTPMQIGDATPVSWVEMIQDIELGDKEFTALLKLAKKADLSMVQIILLFLHYWEGKSETDLGKMYGISHMTISRELAIARQKLHKPLLQAI